ncbi:MAG: CpsB/CapC family capsule biosynthesis tyrosine phosphatase [Gemmatimonadota bacterium]|nr:CpsB/CapC family capsule biosynthesis tyrosine phosphatase [Gemmatimonadota bacterium]
MTRSDGWVDLHSHLVPGVDDGSRSLGESMDAIERLIESGVSRLVTTPHVAASLLARPEASERRLSEIEAAWGRVWSLWEGDERRPFLGLGTEVLLDVPRPDVSDPRCRIEGGRYVLVEFPHSMLPPGSEDALYYVRRQDAVPVIAHVERYNFGVDRESVWREWRDAGAVFQVNVASLAGKYGRRAHEAAWALLEGGWVELIGSDYHARGNPAISEGVEALRERGAAEQLEILYRENPARILAGEDLLEVDPVEALADRSGGGVFGFFRRMTGGER